MESPIKITTRDEFCIEQKPGPCTLIIFGASGDLTQRKLIPAFYNLHKRNLLPQNFHVIGCARSDLGDEGFRQRACDAIHTRCDATTREAEKEFVRCFSYIHGSYDDSALYHALAKKFVELGTGGSHIFYLATPPALYGSIVEHLKGAGLIDVCKQGNPCARIVVEKPFGHDLQSARVLNNQLKNVLDEKQIYRIDHYLGKETVQNIMMFRFANTIFEPIWNSQYIDSVQITVAESIGVEHRAGYYDKAGALRDMFQNHMLQMMSLVAMEPPLAFDADCIRDEKTRLLSAIRPFPASEMNEWIIRGQYGEGVVDGNKVPAYQREEGVDPESRTETYVAAKFLVDNKRWQDVSFYLRAGKRLPRRTSEIAVTFKGAPHSLFQPLAQADLTPNTLVLNVQPDEGMGLTIQAKHPGPKLCMSALTMDFKYADIFHEDLPDAYERLLIDCMLGDQTLFYRQDSMEIAWGLLTPVLEKWEQDGKNLFTYAAGTDGPSEANELLTREGRAWRNL